MKFNSKFNATENPKSAPLKFYPAFSAAQPFEVTQNPKPVPFKFDRNLGAFYSSTPHFSPVCEPKLNMFTIPYQNLFSTPHFSPVCEPKLNMFTIPYQNSSSTPHFSPVCEPNLNMFTIPYQNSSSPTQFSPVCKPELNMFSIPFQNSCSSPLFSPVCEPNLNMFTIPSQNKYSHFPTRPPSNVKHPDKPVVSHGISEVDRNNGNESIPRSSNTSASPSMLKKGRVARPTRMDSTTLAVEIPVVNAGRMQSAMMVVNSSEDVAEAIVNSSDDYSGISDFEIIDDLDNGYHDDLDNDWENVRMKMKKVRVSDGKAGW